MTRVKTAPCELDTLDRIEVDAWVVFVAEDERPLQGLAGLLDWKTAGRLTKLVRDGALSGQAGETLLAASSKTPNGARIFSFGVGRHDPGAFARRVPEAIAALAKAGVKNAALGLPEKPAPKEAARLLTDAVANGPLEEVTLVGA